MDDGDHSDAEDDDKRTHSDAVASSAAAADDSERVGTPPADGWNPDPSGDPNNEPVYDGDTLDLNPAYFSSKQIEEVANAVLASAAAAKTEDAANEAPAATPAPPLFGGSAEPKADSEIQDTAAQEDGDTAQSATPARRSPPAEPDPDDAYVNEKVAADAARGIFPEDPDDDSYINDRIVRQQQEEGGQNPVDERIRELAASGKQAPRPSTPEDDDPYLKPVVQGTRPPENPDYVNDKVAEQVAMGYIPEDGTEQQYINERVIQEQNGGADGPRPARPPKTVGDEPTPTPAPGPAPTPAPAPVAAVPPPEEDEDLLSGYIEEGKVVAGAVEAAPAPVNSQSQPPQASPVAVPPSPARPTAAASSDTRSDYINDQAVVDQLRMIEEKRRSAPALPPRADRAGAAQATSSGPPAATPAPATAAAAATAAAPSPTVASAAAAGAVPAGAVPTGAMPAGVRPAMVRPPPGVRFMPPPQAMGMVPPNMAGGMVPPGMMPPGAMMRPGELKEGVLFGVIYWKMWIIDMNFPLHLQA